MSSDMDTETEEETATDAAPGPGSGEGPDRVELLDPESLIDRLTAAGVLTVEEGESDDILLSEGFRDLIDDACRVLSDTDGTAPRVDVEVSDNEQGRIDELLALTDDEEVTAEYLALVRADVDGLAHEDRLRSLPLIDALRGEVTDDGSPDPFVPVRGSSLPALIPLYERTIVYTWREDCPPCDLMREDFEAVIEKPPEDIVLFSVYGPDYAETLHEHYDVVGGPTTLFCYRGAVDARLTGAHSEQIVESEVRKLREVATARD